MNMEVNEIINTIAYKHNIRKFGTIPKNALPKTKYEDATANGLTACIIDFIFYSGHQAERVAVVGRWKGKRIKSSMQIGTADVHATINGRSVKIEIKIGNDKQSEAQKQYQKSIEASGGFYFIAKDFESFHHWYNLNFSNGN